MQFWLKTHVVQATTDKLTKDNVKLVLKELSFVVGDKMIKKVIEDIVYARMTKITCNQLNLFSLYLLRVELRDHVFTDTSTVCTNCTEMNKETSFICSHYVMFRVFLKLKMFELASVNLKDFRTLVRKRMLNYTR